LSKIQGTLDPVKLALALYYQENGGFPVASITTATASATGNLWDSIGITIGQTPTLPPEVSLLDVTVAAATPTIAKLTLTMGAGKIKATTIDGLLLEITGTASGTAILWECTTGTTITDKIALTYFSKGQANPATCI
jgi:hypothetical protein